MKLFDSVTVLMYYLDRVKRTPVPLYKDSDAGRRGSPGIYCPTILSRNHRTRFGARDVICGANWINRKILAVVARDHPVCGGTRGEREPPAALEGAATFQSHRRTVVNPAAKQVFPATESYLIITRRLKITFKITVNNDARDCRARRYA